MRRRYERDLSDDLNGTLSPRRRRRLERALERDVGLRDRLEAYQALRRLAQEDEVPADMHSFGQYFAEIARRLPVRPARSEGERRPFAAHWAWGFAPVGVAVLIGAWIGVRQWIAPLDAGETAVAVAPVKEAPIRELARSAEVPETAAPPKLDESVVESRTATPKPNAAARLLPQRKETTVETDALEADTSDGNDSEDAVFSTVPVDETAEPGVIALAESPLRQRLTTAATEAALSAAPETTNAADSSEAFPFEVRLMLGDRVLERNPLREGLGGTVEREGITYAYRLTREDDGRWKLSTGYRPKGDIADAETLTWFFGLAETPSEEEYVHVQETVRPASIRRRLAQPRGTTPRYALVIAPTP